jgi:hypothetical protein
MSNYFWTVINNFIFHFFAGKCQSLPEDQEDQSSMEFSASVSDFCQEFINDQINLQTLVRLSGPAIDCPFTGKFTFTYKTGKTVFS